MFFKLITFLRPQECSLHTDITRQKYIQADNCPHIHTQKKQCISRQCIRFKTFIITETGQHVDKCPDGPSFQRMLPFILQICISAQPPDRTAHDTAKYNCFPTSFLLPLCPRIIPLFCSLLQMFILKIYFSLGLKQGLHLNFSFTKQENILLDWNSIKEK